MQSLKKSQIGKAGEFLVQYRLLCRGVESAPLATDAGVDLVAYSPRNQKAYTIQVKTNLQPKPAGGIGKLALDWWIPDDSPTDLVACVDLSIERVWILRMLEVANLAQQHSNGRYHLYMWCDPTVARRKDRLTIVEQFEDYRCTKRIPTLFL